MPSGKKSPPSDLKTAQQSVQSQVILQNSTFSGPIPPPDILQKYNQIEPGLAKIIITMAQEESAHRRINENKSVECQIEHIKVSDAQSTRGQHYALAFAVFSLLTSAYTALHGAQISASIIGGTSIVAIVTAFIYGKSEK